jgi:hypothetical protein
MSWLARKMKIDGSRPRIASSIAVQQPRMKGQRLKRFLKIDAELRLRRALLRMCNDDEQQKDVDRFVEENSLGGRRYRERR